MLWVALHLPQLESQARARGHASPEAARAALEAVALWMERYTPKVSLEPPEGLAAELGASLKRYGGAGRLAREIRAGLAQLGFDARIAFAPTARAALWRAAGGGLPLEALPVAVLGLDPDREELLDALGVHTLGALMRLPREGVARRFGQTLVDELDRALGRLPEARTLYVPPARFAARLELPAPVAEAQATLFAARRLLAQLEGFLVARCSGVRRFVLELLHPKRAATTVEVGLAAPARDAEHFARLLRERLERLSLPAPAEAVRLAAVEIEPLPGRTGALFPGPEEASEDWRRLLDRLQARLGTDAVHGLGLRSEHRPERAWLRLAPEGAAGIVLPAYGARPLWLLDPPRPLAEGEFELLAGPERIESGWWDGAEIRRDYFVARARDSLLWIYRDAQGWRLHGLFA
ncbi:MAG: DNA polymerase Y family protein [Burkholderiales bacterium]|nr:DNA polymerase Y family protein [Burkholderiales bacterium]